MGTLDGWLAVQAACSRLRLRNLSDLIGKCFHAPRLLQRRLPVHFFLCKCPIRRVDNRDCYGILAHMRFIILPGLLFLAACDYDPPLPPTEEDVRQSEFSRCIRIQGEASGGGVHSEESLPTVSFTNDEGETITMRITAKEACREREKKNGK